MQIHATVNELHGVGSAQLELGANDEGERVVADEQIVHSVVLVIETHRAADWQIHSTVAREANHAVGASDDLRGQNAALQGVSCD